MLLSIQYVSRGNFLALADGLSCYRAAQGDRQRRLVMYPRLSGKLGCHPGTPAPFITPEWPTLSGKITGEQLVSV